VRRAGRVLALPAALLAASSACGEAASAQAMRPFATFRQLHGETRLYAELEYTAGSVRVAPGRPGELYRMTLAYDAARYVPLSAYDAARGGVRLGLEATGAAGLRVISDRQLRQRALVTLSPAVDLALDLTLGAADAEAELGGLRITDLTLQTGASHTTVRFSHPNGTRCRAAELTAGAAEVEVLGLGNSRCDELRLEGGAGQVTLDFGGAWSAGMRADLKMAMGELTLRLPRGLGVRITADKILAGFDAAGLARRGDAYVSPGYDRASRRLDIALTTALGAVTVEWTAGEQPAAH
jgi:hypothetical protein